MQIGLKNNNAIKIYVLYLWQSVKQYLNVSKYCLTDSILEKSRAHTSNLFGTYEGTLPAADCEGIKTILVINEDKTYTLKSEYIGREDATFETSGIYHIIGDSIMELVTPSSGEKTYYRMLNNRQVMLSDKEGTISQSLLAEHYILNKK